MIFHKHCMIHYYCVHNNARIEGESLSGKLTTTKYAGGAYRQAVLYARKGTARRHAMGKYDHVYRADHKFNGNKVSLL